MNKNQPIAQKQKAPAKPQPKKDAKKSIVQQKKVPEKQVAKKKEEPKKQEVKKEQQPPQKMEVHYCTVQGFLQKWEVIDQQEHKSVIIVDTTNVVQTFLKYSGIIFDISEFIVKSGLETTTLKEFQETVRSRLVVALKTGYPTVFNYDLFTGTEKSKLDVLFKDCEFYQKSMLFDPKVIKTRAYYGKHLLTEDEDVDAFGNKGWFSHKDDFRLAILVGGEEEEDYLKVIEHNDLDKQQFQIIVVKK